MRGLRLALAVGLLVVCGRTAVQAAQEPIPLNDYTRLGQRFTATRPFNGIWVVVPSWSDSEGGLTLTLWDSPRRTKRLAQRSYTDIADNARIELPLRKTLPAGSYYWEADQRTGETRVGFYAEILDEEIDDCIYLDGVPNRKRRFLSGISPLPRTYGRVSDLTAMLRRGTHTERIDACRQLAVVGTRQVVPLLARLLADEELSHMARFALQPMPGSAVDAAFRAALKRVKGPLLVGVINSIGARRDAAAVTPLASLLRDGDPAVVAAAAAALGAIGTPAAADRLEQALASAPSSLRPALHEGGLLCAERLLQQGQRERAAALFDRIRAEQAPAVVRAAALRGALAARGEEGLPLLLEQLHGTDAALAGAALWVAQRELPGPAVTEALAQALDQLPAERQPALIEALAQRADAAALSALLATARSGAMPIRLTALRVLPGLGSAEVVPVLVDALAEPDNEVSSAAREALAALPAGELAAAIDPLLRSPEARSQLAGIDLAVRRGLSRFAPALLEVGASAEPQVRLAALKALGALAGAAEFPGLLKVMAGADEELELDAAEQALAAVCARMGDAEECAAKLAAGLAPAAPPQRAALLRVLAELGGARALQAVREALGDADPEVKATALQLL
ncbi:MAG: hypothetical protein GX774_04535, partial [Armatimonadetes bacterium]|nr:hypothetical protein [Armatimonadota bacterium]